MIIHKWDLVVIIANSGKVLAQCYVNKGNNILRIIRIRRKKCYATDCHVLY